jgi:hypothetical protein
MKEQQNKQLDTRLQELHGLSARIERLNAEQEALRKEIFGIIENEGLTDGYKNALATVSYVERKTVKVSDQETLLKDLQEQKIVKYFAEVPEVVVPAHIELKPELMKDVKSGKFSHPAIEVQTATNLAVRFNEEAK